MLIYCRERHFPSGSGFASTANTMHPSQTAVLLLVASIFAFIRSVYNLAAAAAFWIPEMTPSSARLDLILSAVFGYILLFVSLVLLFAAGVKKIGGLVSHRSFKPEYPRIVRPVTNLCDSGLPPRTLRSQSNTTTPA